MNHISKAMSRLIDLQLQRHAWILRDGERLKAERISKGSATAVQQTVANNHGN